jgi:hypothetical protein
MASFLFDLIFQYFIELAQLAYSLEKHFFLNAGFSEIFICKSSDFIKKSDDSNCAKNTCMKPWQQ